MIKFIKNIYVDYKAKKFLIQLKHDSQMLYRMGYDTDVILISIKLRIAEKNNVHTPEIQKLFRNLRRLITSFHPTNPTYFESVP